MAKCTRASVDEVLTRFQVGDKRFIEALGLRDGFVSVQGEVLVEMAEVIAAANAEIERLRALAYAAQEFLSPEEWRFEQPSYKPGLDARLHDLEHAIDSALGDGWRDRHAANVAELAAKLRPRKDHPHA